MVTMGDANGVCQKSAAVSDDDAVGRKWFEGSRERFVHHSSQDFRILVINVGLFNVNSSILIGYLGS